MCFANPGHKTSFGWRAPELLCWLPPKELLLHTPAGLVLGRRDGEAAFWVTESQGLLTQLTRQPGCVLTEQ